MFAWMKRFCGNTRSSASNRRSGDITLEEYLEAEQVVLKVVQRESFHSIHDPTIASLKPFVDDEGIIKTRTKVSERNDSQSFRFPTILPSNHVITKLLIKETHESNTHAGIQTVMAILREKFWILKCRRTVRQTIGNCGICKRFKTKQFEPPPAPLPEDRVKDCVVFQTTGIDLAGPLFLRNGKKVWIVIFTCGVYRAVHLELATSVSTKSFLECLRKFIARRGRPQIIYSDNGTNFKGTNNLFKTIDWKEVEKISAIKRIKWKFNPPTAAWWGGWWERLIRILKDILKRILGKSSLNYEEMITVLCEVENVINSRPLTYISEDIEDLNPLTPNMFLRDNIESSTADFDYINGKELNKRWLYRMKLRKDLKNRFRSQYLGELKHVRKNRKTYEPAKVGQIVLIGKENVKRLDWPLGMIVDLYVGKDGIHRVAKVRTKGGEIIRPLQRLYPLEVPDKDEIGALLPNSNQISDNISQQVSFADNPDLLDPDTADAPTPVSEPVPDDSNAASEVISPGRQIPTNLQTRRGRVVRPPDRYLLSCGVLSATPWTQGGEDVTYPSDHVS